MKISIASIVLAGAMSVFASCSKENAPPPIPTTPIEFGKNSLLLMTADYLTNGLKGGTVMSFSDSTATFTPEATTVSAGDFGSIRIKYKELDTTIFYRTVIWAGVGKMEIPQRLDPPSFFEGSKLEAPTTANFVFPQNGIQDIVLGSVYQIDDAPFAWLHLQALSAVRQFFSSYPDTKVYTFLYNPSVGIVGNGPTDWYRDSYWVFFLKN